ncbi:MAG: hypothetical protein OXN95_09570, partial [bacterium]|nr:hypothetical protein [bacterium]
MSADALHIADLEADLRKEPVNPTINYENGTFLAVPGIAGEIVDLNPSLPVLLEAARRGDDPFRAEAEARLIPPEFDD